MDRTITIRIRGTWLRYLIVILVTVLVAAPAAVLASHGFTDVPDSNIFHDDIDWLADNGVTLGCNPPANDEFCPGDDVTRAQMAAFMRRFAQYLGAEDGTPAEADNADTLDGLDSSAFGAAFDPSRISWSYRLELQTAAIATSGGGTVTEDCCGLEVVSGGTAGDSAYVNWGSKTGTLGYNRELAARWIMSNVLVQPDGGIVYMYAFGDTGDGEPTAMSKYAGFRVEGGNGTRRVFAVSSDGTTEESTEVTAFAGNLTNLNEFRSWMVVYEPGVDIKFHINSALVATHTTYILPSSDTSTAFWDVGFMVENTDGNSAEVEPVVTILQIQTD